MLYISELVSQNVQKIANISDLGILGELLEGMPWSKVWFVGLINSTYWPLLSNKYFNWQYTWLDYRINILVKINLHGALYTL